MTGHPEFVTWEPHPALRAYVDGYVGYRQHDVTLAVHRGLPSHHLTVIISLAEPVRLIGGPGRAGGALRSAAMVGGLHLGPALIEQDRYQCGVHVMLRPFAAKALLGVGPAELSSTVVELADLPARWGRDLPARLAERGRWRERFELLDRVLLASLRPVTLLSDIEWAWRRLAGTAGDCRVAALAGEVGWSMRHFRHRFAGEVGVSPKQAARLMRFERSGALLRSGGYRNLAEVAARCGYYDQPHLTAEWRQLAGCTPGEWIAEELPFLQGVEGPS